MFKSGPNRKFKINVILYCKEGCGVNENFACFVVATIEIRSR